MKQNGNGNGSVKKIPDGFHTVTPHLVIRGAAKAIDFYKKAFGAQEIMCMSGPDGKTVMHGEIKIGNSIVFLAEEFPNMGCASPQALGNSPVTLCLYVEDCDTVFNQAVAAGAQVRMPLSDMFWGDRYGQVIDPFGHIWSIATHREDVSPAELRKRAEALFAAGGQCADEPAHA